MTKLNFLACPTSFVSTPNGSNPMSDLNDSLRTLLSAAVERKVAPGLVAVVTNRTGEIAQSAVGYSDSDKQTPLGLNSSIWLASMSKAVVSLAALVLGDSSLLPRRIDSGSDCKLTYDSGEA